MCIQWHVWNYFVYAISCIQSIQMYSFSQLHFNPFMLKSSSRNNLLGLWYNTLELAMILQKYFSRNLLVMNRLKSSPLRNSRLTFTCTILSNLQAVLAVVSINPFILGASLESIVSYHHTFENNLEIKRKLTKHFEGTCCLAFEQHFSFKRF